MNYTFTRNALLTVILACPVGAVAYVVMDAGPEAETASAASNIMTVEPEEALAFVDDDSTETAESSTTSIPDTARTAGTFDDEASSSSSSSTTRSSSATTASSSTTTSTSTTTAAPTTVAPTTAAPTTTAAPRTTTTKATPTTTAAPTTAAPTTTAAARTTTTKATPTTTAPTTAAPTTAAPTTTAAHASAQQQAAAISFTQLNATRAQVGLAPLVVDPAMSTFATNWSIEMISSGFRHSSGPYAENIAWHSNGNMTPQNAAQYFNQAWVNSPGHYANMTNASYTHVGIGLVQDSSGWWATHVFR